MMTTTMAWTLLMGAKRSLSRTARVRGRAGELELARA